MIALIAFKVTNTSSVQESCKKCSHRKSELAYLQEKFMVVKTDIARMPIKKWVSDVWRATSQTELND